MFIQFDVQNTNIFILCVYFVYFKFLGRDEMGIQRYNGRGETGEGTWEGMDIQMYNGKGKTGLGKREQEHALQLFCRHLLLFSSSTFGIAGIREEAAGLP